MTTDYNRFTRGDCAILASAINKRTGLPLCTFTTVYAGKELPDRHAFVQLPDGRCLDVEGVCTEAEFRNRWCAMNSKIQRFGSYTELIERDPRWNRAWFGPGNYSFLRAHQVAAKLVREHAVC